MSISSLVAMRIDIGHTRVKQLLATIASVFPRNLPLIKVNDQRKVITVIYHHHNSIKYKLLRHAWSCTYGTQSTPKSQLHIYLASYSPLERMLNVMNHTFELLFLLIRWPRLFELYCWSYKTSHVQETNVKPRQPTVWPYWCNCME